MELPYIHFLRHLEGLKRPLAHFLDLWRRFTREIASVRPEENIDVATTMIPQNSGIRLFFIFKLKYTVKIVREKEEKKEIMAGIVFHGLPYQLSEASGSMEFRTTGPRPGRADRA